MPANTVPYNASTYAPPAETLDAEGSPSATAAVGSPSTIPPTFPEGQNVIPNEGVPDTPAFDQVKFLGATVIGFTTSVGWNEQQTTVTVNLVEDKRSGDDFILKHENSNNYQGRLIGRPVSFIFSGFRFDGLISGYEQNNNFQGNPVFQVTLVNPTLLLEGTQVILSNYVGPTNDSLFNGTTKAPTFQLSNILNVYGYLEDGGRNFGNAEANDTGLLWEGQNGVKEAIQTLTNTNQVSYASPTVNFGSYLFYMDHAYRLDFSALPVAPSFYRIGGSTNTSLLEIISSICDSAGVYYLVCLDIAPGNGPHTIYFKIADLVSSTNLNAIAEYISGQEVSGSTVGQELRTSDVTQAMILGGDITTLYPLENWGTSDPAVIPFWGFDIDGNPITGQKPDGTFFADDDHAMLLNASEIADVMGAIGLTPRYPCSILELRCALIDYDSWATFLYVYKREFAQALGIYGATYVEVDGDLPGQLIIDCVNDRLELAQQLGSMNNNSQWTTISQRVYEYVRDQAETYYGRQFLVKIPFQLQIKVVPDTTQVFYSDEPADAGFLPELSLPLGLNYINENFFLTPDGRMSPFFRFQFNSTFRSVSGTKIVTVNASRLPSEAVIQADARPENTYVYVGYGAPENSPILQNGVLAGGNIIFARGAAGFPVPAMVCTIPSPLWAQGTDPLGGIEDLAAILNMPIENLVRAAQFRADSFPMRINPPAFYPNGVAIAMKSNQYTYGPWGKFTANGRVHFEQDTSLTPWDYGGYDNLNLGAFARLATIQNPNQVKEKGSVNQPGAPLASLGDVLIDKGPTIGNIEVTVDPQQGITTSYSMETYVPRFGKFNDENQTRLKRFGQASQQMRKSIRQLVIEKTKRQQVVNLANKGYMQGASYAVQQRTPHAVMGGHLVYDSGVDGMVPMAYMETYRESVANVNAHDEIAFRASTCMGLDGLFRSISTNTGMVVSGQISDSSFPLISHYQPIRGSVIAATPVTNSGIQPLRPGGDIFWFTHGDTYNKLNNKRAPSDLTNARLMALRGPMLLSGWGYDIQGKPIPNAVGSGTDLLQEYTSSFKTDYLKNSQDWPTGAVALHFDQMRGVWTVPTMMMGWISGSPLGSYGNAKMAITLGDGVSTGDVIDVSSFYRATVETGVRVQAMYYQLDNKYYVFSADCETDS